MGKAITVVASGVLPLAHFGGTALADAEGLLGTGSSYRSS